MERTKELQLLQTVIGVITLNVGGTEKAFTVFYGGAMYPWINNKMLVMPEDKYKNMLKEFFLNEGKEYIVPTPQKIAQDRAEVINNYRAGMYANPDNYSYQPVENHIKEEPKAEQAIEEHIDEVANEPQIEEQTEEPAVEEYAEEPVEESQEAIVQETEIQEEPQEVVEEPEQVIEEPIEDVKEGEPVFEEQHEEEAYFDTEEQLVETEEEKPQEKAEITSETIDLIRSKHLIDDKTMLKDGLAFVNEIEDIGSLFTKPASDAIDDLIISATDDELAEMARFLVRKYNLEDKLVEEHSQETIETEQVAEPEQNLSDIKAEEFVGEPEPETPVFEEPVAEEQHEKPIDTSEYEIASNEVVDEPSRCEPKREEAEPVSESEPKREITREIIYKTDDTKIEELFEEIKKLQREVSDVKQSNNTSSELSVIDDKLSYLIKENRKPDSEMQNLSSGIQELISSNRDIDLSQVTKLVDEQNRMMAKQSEAIQELTQTVENQKEIIDKFKGKIDQTQKAEKTRVKKTWIIMILGVIIMVGITVCTQLFLPKAESAIKLDSNTDAEVHIVIHNDDGTDSFERIGSIIIRDGKLELAE